MADLSRIETGRIGMRGAVTLVALKSLARRMSRNFSRVSIYGLMSPRHLLRVRQWPKRDELQSLRIA